MEKEQKEISKEQNLSQAQKKEELIQKSKISLILSTYDDIFSDFDPRSFVERALSHDFLFEARNAAKDKILGLIELSFLIPKNLRNVGTEALVRKRLRDHFRKHHAQLHKDVKKIRYNGLKLIVGGVIFGALATAIATSSLGAILRNFLLIITEPACWYLLWSGLDHVFFRHETKKEELEFYEKMIKAPISFHTY